MRRSRPRFRTRLVRDKDIAALLDSVDALSDEITDLRRELTEQNKLAQAAPRLIAELEAKEKVIQRQRIALVALAPLLRAAALARPRLFSFNHYPPRPLALPPPEPSAPRHAPKISIVTPTFQHSRFIEMTLLSVLEQHYPNLQYTVQDGGSTDGAVDILKRYSARLSSWTSEPDRGQSDAINRGFARCDGEIMAWLNSDDLLMPGALATVGRYFAAHPTIDVVYGHRAIIDEDGLQIGRWIMPPHDDEVLRWADYVPQETLFWRRRAWEAAGGRIDETFRFAMDWDLLLRFRASGAKFARIPRVLGAFRVHAAQKTSTEIEDAGAQEMRRLRRKIHGFDPSHDQIRVALRGYMARHLLEHYAFAIREKWEALASARTQNGDATVRWRAHQTATPAE